MKEVILGKSFISFLIVACLLNPQANLKHDLASLKHIQEIIQERNHTVVLSVQSLLHDLTI
jgi:hypothetical protein